MLCSVAILPLVAGSLNAQLITIDYTQPITSKVGSDNTLVGNVPLGTPLHFSFTYDATHPTSSGVNSPGSAWFYFNTPQTHSEMNVGAFSFQMNPPTQVDFSFNNGIVFGKRVFRGDSAQFISSTLPAPSEGLYETMTAVFLWPTGTFGTLDNAILPDATPIAIELIAHIHQSATDEVWLHALQFPNGIPPLTAVPEPATYGMLASVFLAAVLVKRIRSKRPPAFQSMLNVPRPL